MLLGTINLLLGVRYRFFYRPSLTLFSKIQVLYVKNFTAQEHASSKTRSTHFKFQSYGGAWHKAMNMFVENYILISGFLTFLEVNVLGKMLIRIFAWSVHIISGDSESKFQMFTLFSGRHVGVQQMNTNLAFSCWTHTGVNFLRKISTKISEVWGHAQA